MSRRNQHKSVELPSCSRSIHLSCHFENKRMFRLVMQVMPWCDRVPHWAGALIRPTWPVGSKIVRTQMRGRRIEGKHRCELAMRSCRGDDASMLAIRDDDPYFCHKRPCVTNTYIWCGEQCLGLYNSPY